MSDPTVIDAARRALGRIGAFLPTSTAVAPPSAQQRDAVHRFEAAGYRAAWTNEGVGGKDAFVQLALLLAASDRLVLGTGITNIWARTPQTAHAAAAQLAEAFPGRFVLGLGVGYPQQAASAGQDFGTPLATLRDYVGRMSAPTQMPAPDVTFPRILAANGPKMLALAAELADGAIPALKPPEFTAQAREILGPDKLLVVLTDSSTDQDDVESLAARVRDHLAAGADHVVLSSPQGADYASSVDHLERLAPAVTSL